MDIKIESNIPIPSKRVTDHELKYPFNRMEVGDSFFLDKVHAQKLLSAAHAYAKRNKLETIKFTVRKEKTGCRIWRIK